MTSIPAPSRPQWSGLSVSELDVCAQQADLLLDALSAMPTTAFTIDMNSAVRERKLALADQKARLQEAELLRATRTGDAVEFDRALAVIPAALRDVRLCQVLLVAIHDAPTLVSSVLALRADWDDAALRPALLSAIGAASLPTMLVSLVLAHCGRWENASLQEALLAAVKADTAVGELSLVGLVLAQRDDLDVGHALRDAVADARPAALNTLIGRVSADVRVECANQVDEKGETLLHRAVRRCEQCVHVLISHGARVRAPDGGADRAAALAQQQAALAAKRGAAGAGGVSDDDDDDDDDERDPSWMPSAIHVVTIPGAVHLVAGANGELVDLPTADGRTRFYAVLHEAAPRFASSEPRMPSYFSGSERSLPTWSGREHLALMRALLAAGASAAARVAPPGEPAPLLLATHCACVDVGDHTLALLDDVIARGGAARGDATGVDAHYNGVTSLTLSVTWLRHAVTERLLRAGADVNVRAPQCPLSMPHHKGVTPLFKDAALHTPLCPSERSGTALHCALDERLRDLRDTNHEGRAVEVRRQRVALMLLAAGADPNLVGSHEVRARACPQACSPFDLVAQFSADRASNVGWRDVVAVMRVRSALARRKRARAEHCAVLAVVRARTSRRLEYTRDATELRPASEELVGERVRVRWTVGGAFVFYEGTITSFRDEGGDGGAPREHEVVYDDGTRRCYDFARLDPAHWALLDGLAAD